MILEIPSARVPRVFFGRSAAFLFFLDRTSSPDPQAQQDIQVSDFVWHLAQEHFADRHDEFWVRIGTFRTREPVPLPPPPI